MWIQLWTMFLWGVIIPVIIMIAYNIYRAVVPADAYYTIDGCRASIMSRIPTLLILIEIGWIWYKFINGYHWVLTSIENIILSTFLAILALWAPMLCMINDKDSSASRTGNKS